MCFSHFYHLYNNTKQPPGETPEGLKCYFAVKTAPLSCVQAAIVNPQGISRGAGERTAAADLPEPAWTELPAEGCCTWCS